MKYGILIALLSLAIVACKNGNSDQGGAQAPATQKNADRPEGTKSTLLIPSAKAYGSRDRGTIPPNTPLAFDVEVLMPTK